MRYEDIIFLTAEPAPFIQCSTVPIVDFDDEMR
jgi:hypothetical protein